MNYSNEHKKLVVLVWPEGHPDAGDIVAACNHYRLYKRPVKTRRDPPARDHARLEIRWGDFDQGFGQEDASGIVAIPVAIVECDGASKLSLGRIGTGDGLPPECRLESCMEISDDRGSPHDLPIENSFSLARSLVSCARDQGFPVRRLHHPTHDHRRIHCIGRLVRT